ncbi:MAG: nucleotidyltransferase family protein [Chloroflexota bacterium]|jgi:uncharacterized protein
MNRFDELSRQVIPILKPYVKMIAVFGSFARGEETQNSDIDLLVELKSPDQRPPLGLQWFTLEEQLSQQAGRPVELVSEEGLSPHIRPFIEKEKVILYVEN